MEVPPMAKLREPKRRGNTATTAPVGQQGQDGKKARQKSGARLLRGEKAKRTKAEALAVRALASVKRKMKQSTLAMADREVAEMQVNRALYRGEYFAPEPYQTETGLTLLKTVAYHAYMVASTVDGVPPRNLDLLRRLMAEADSLTQRQAGNAPRVAQSGANPADFSRPMVKDSTPAAVQQGGQAGKWPWGTYKTKKLEVLAGAVQELWTGYDPAKPRETAPTNEKVEKWLNDHGVTSVRIRQVMATIIRADDLRRGPRPLPD